MSAKVIYAVQCQRHGTEIIKGGGKSVRVPQPLTRKEKKHSGCPFCRREIAAGEETQGG